MAYISLYCVFVCFFKKSHGQTLGGFRLTTAGKSRNLRPNSFFDLPLAYGIANTCIDVKTVV